MDAKDFMPDEATIARIRADLDRYEGDRALAAAKVRLRMPAYVGGVLVIVAVLAYAFNSFADPNEQWFSSPHVFLYFGGIVALFFAYSAAMGPATKLQQSFREHMLPIVFGFIKDVRYSHGTTPDSFHHLPREAVGTFNRQTFDDTISGTYNGFTFELYEATLKHKQGKSDQLMFKGIVMAFHMLRPFPGKLVATRRADVVTSFFRGIFGNTGLPELKSGVETLDKKYEFRTDNPEVAQPLVSGHLAQALQWLGETWPEQPSRVGLQGNDGYLLIPQNKNYFELPSISTKLDYNAHIAPMIADMAALLATASLVRRVGADEEPAAAQPDPAA
ncbi:MAG: DUF3137 domain-containing protein [Rhizobiaceae bacterium]